MILQSDFDIGFEIEGIALESNYYNIKKVAEKYGLLFLTGDTSIKEDENIIELSYSEYNGIEYEEKIIPFELNMKPFGVSPKSLIKTYEYFKELYYEGLITNDTCSLHLHIKLKNNKLNSKKSFNHAAMMLAYLYETGEYKKLLAFNNQKMSHAFWANEKDMEEQYNKLKNNFMNNNFIDCSRNIKRGIFYAHPQGTLEWRGPRKLLDLNTIAFCNNKSIDEENRLYKFVKYIFSVIPLLQNAYNNSNKNINKDSLYMNLYNYNKRV
jgi:hypothetical protein